MSIVYLNGEYLPKSEAKISPDDRGFLLGDGVYEVAAFYIGVPFGLEEHLRRLDDGLAWMRIDLDVAPLADVFRTLIERNDLGNEQRSLVYMQVTRGVAPRTHYFPETPVEPTVYAYAKAWSRPADDVWNRGFSATTEADRRWARVDVKTICLLPNAIAFQNAKDKGADDAILCRDGVALEGAHQNFWAVIDGRVVTHPLTNHVLPGITRNAVLELARSAGMDVVERPIQVEELATAEEAFFTGTTGEVKPVVEIDGQAVGDGSVGPITRRLSDDFLTEVARVVDAGMAAESPA